LSHVTQAHFALGQPGTAHFIAEAVGPGGAGTFIVRKDSALPKKNGKKPKRILRNTVFFA
jgi:hypothetical protein